jgi:hypothetical protein
MTIHNARLVQFSHKSDDPIRHERTRAIKQTQVHCPKRKCMRANLDGARLRALRSHPAATSYGRGIDGTSHKASCTPHRTVYNGFTGIQAMYSVVQSIGWLLEQTTWCLVMCAMLKISSGRCHMGAGSMEPPTRPAPQLKGRSVYGFQPGYRPCIV